MKRARGFELPLRDVSGWPSSIGAGRIRAGSRVQFGQAGPVLHVVSSHPVKRRAANSPSARLRRLLSLQGELSELRIPRPWSKEGRTPYNRCHVEVRLGVSRCRQNMARWSTVVAASWARCYWRGRWRRLWNESWVGGGGEVVDLLSMLRRMLTRCCCCEALVRRPVELLESRLLEVRP